MKRFITKKMKDSKNPKILTMLRKTRLLKDSYVSKSWEKLPVKKSRQFI